jgi:WD40 repeat protein
MFFIDTATSQVREPPLSCGSTVWRLAFKDNMIVAGCLNGQIKIFKLNESQDLWKIQPESSLTGHSSAVTGVAFSADGQWLVSGSCDTTIRLWDARPGGGTVVSAV